MNVDQVGPVLESGEVAQAIVAAIRQLNRSVSVIDRGSYLRVLVPERCVLTRAALEAILGRPFQLPSDLELCMPAFQGRLQIDEDRAEWSFEGA